MFIVLLFVPYAKVEEEFTKLLDYYLNTNTVEYLINLMFWFKKTILLTTKNFTAGLFLKMI
jgi:hypothetical protein